MLASVVVFIIDFWLRWKGTQNENLPFTLSVIGVIVICFGGWIGGDLVHVHGVAVFEKDPNSKTTT
jgi:uncharacterized membrane protein